MHRTLAPLLTILFLAGCATKPASDDATMGARGIIVAFGDSYTEGNGATREEAYPARLAAALDRAVLNKGITGETAGEAHRRLDRDVRRHAPELVIVEFGVNEAFRGIPVEQALADIETIVARTQRETNASIIIVGVHFWTYQENFDEGLREIARRHGTGLVTDVLDGIVSSRKDRDDGDPRLRSDAFHPNARGYAIMAERILPAVELQLTTRASSPSTR